MKKLLQQLTEAFGPSGYEDEVREIVTREPGCAARNRPQIDVRFERGLARMHAQNLLAALQIRIAHGHLTIEAAGTQEGLVEHVRAVCAATDLGVIIYSRANAVYSDTTVARLAERATGRMGIEREPGAAALRAAEMGAEAIFKGTQVDGIYSADPKKDPSATRFDRLTHSEVLERGLAVMDVAAVALARENAIPIVVFSIHEKGGFAEILTGGGHATIVTDN